MGWSKAWLPKKPGAQTKPKARRGVMNKEEADFARILSLRPGVKRVVFEAVTLHIGGGAKYTPDLVAFMHDGTIAIFEIKGFRETASIVRLKVATGLFPEIPFHLAEFDRKSGWTEKRMLP